MTEAMFLFNKELELYNNISKLIIHPLRLH